MNVTKNIFLTMRESDNDIRNSERGVADYIMKNPEKVVYMTIDQRAYKTFTSTATILRLVKKLGENDYRSFKITLASAISSLQIAATEKMDASDPHGIINLVSENNVRTI